MLSKKCLCGREITKEFNINNNKKVDLCPLCSYEIMKQMLEKYELFENFLRMINEKT